ncbi:MAG: SDR family oxidoreductase [Elusimicrobia bacterium]|nr:SDR family oxidoreductase [Elusimicrobiota bacterium]
MSKLHDKRIIITGASKGLGAVVAQALADNGAKLVLIARSADKLEEVRLACKNPEQHVGLAVDLTQTEALAACVQKARDFLGGVDAVVHAAGGGLGFHDALLEPEKFQKLFALNLGSAAEINRLVVPEMKQRRSGNLVHVGSIASYEGVGSVGYNAVKAALAAYVRSLGRELAVHHVVATGILPGGFTAPDNAMRRLQASNPEAYKEFIETRLPRKIMGEASELIPMVLLLCSGEASMMAGCMVPIDAGEGRAYNTLS